MDREARDRVISEFRNGTTKILISTDVLARGFDVTQVRLTARGAAQGHYEAGLTSAVLLRQPAATLCSALEVSGASWPSCSASSPCACLQRSSATGSQDVIPAGDAGHQLRRAHGEGLSDACIRDVPAPHWAQRALRTQGGRLQPRHGAAGVTAAFYSRAAILGSARRGYKLVCTAAVPHASESPLCFLLDASV